MTDVPIYAMDPGLQSISESLTLGDLDCECGLEAEDCVPVEQVVRDVYKSESLGNRLRYVEVMDHILKRCDQKVDVFGKYIIPGRGERTRDSCGTIYETYISMRDFDVVCKHDYCYASSCPICWSKWAERAAMRASNRLWAISTQLKQKLRHFVWSPDITENGWTGDRDDFKLKDLTKYLNTYSREEYTGWAYVLHPYRFKTFCDDCLKFVGNSETSEVVECPDCGGSHLRRWWVYSPHVHVISNAFIPFDDKEAIQFLKRVGCVFVNIYADRESDVINEKSHLYKLINYEVGHCAIVNPDAREQQKAIGYKAKLCENEFLEEWFWWSIPKRKNSKRGEQKAIVYCGFWSNRNWKSKVVEKREIYPVDSWGYPFFAVEFTHVSKNVLHLTDRVVMKNTRVPEYDNDGKQIFDKDGKPVWVYREIEKILKIIFRKILMIPTDQNKKLVMEVKKHGTSKKAKIKKGLIVQYWDRDIESISRICE